MRHSMPRKAKKAEKGRDLRKKQEKSIMEDDKVAS